MNRNVLLFLLTAAPLLGLPLERCSDSPDDAAAEIRAAAPADTAAPPEAAAVAAPPDTLPETNYYEIRTPQGRMVVRLYDETPGHRDNFKKLVAEQFYDSTLFHRVVSRYMIQGGDPNSLDDDPMNDGVGGPGYTLAAELRPELIHKRGALAAARQGDPVNPERRSSGSQFYIVQGAVYPDSILTQVEQMLKQEIPDADFAFPDTVRARYTTEGGAPNLDRMYTVFGELVEGFDVLDRIATVPTPRNIRQRTMPQLIDRPLEDIPMVIRPLPDYQE